MTYHLDSVNRLTKENFEKRSFSKPSKREFCQISFGNRIYAKFSKKNQTI